MGFTRTTIPFKSTPDITCGWCCLAQLLRGFTGYSMAPGQPFKHGLTTKDKLIILARFGFIPTEMPANFELSRYAGIYLVEGTLTDGTGHSILMHADELDMNIYVYDPLVGTWETELKPGFRVSNVLLIEYAPQMKLSFEDRS